MPEEWELLGVTSDAVGQTPCYRVRLGMPGNRQIDHVFPKATIDIRAGEYDIDHTTPEGLQQILDVILHEPHGVEPRELWEADTVEQARSQMLTRTERTKTDRVNVHWSGNGRTRGSMRMFANGNDPAQLLLNHRPDPQVKAQSQNRIRSIRGRLGLEPRGPVQPRVQNIIDPSVIQRRQLTSSSHLDENAEGPGVA